MRGAYTSPSKNDKETHIFYKNVAKTNAFYDCPIFINCHASIQSCALKSIEQAIIEKKDKDIIIPYAYINEDTSTHKFIQCYARIKSCDLNGEPVCTVNKELSPQICVRTNRGIWNVLELHNCFLFPKDQTIIDIQLVIKDGSLLKGMFLLEFFTHDDIVIGRTHNFMILSKPSEEHKGKPFGKIVLENKISKSQTITKKISPCSKKFQVSNIQSVIISVEASKKIAPFQFIALGNYRHAPKFQESKKRQRE